MPRRSSAWPAMEAKYVEGVPTPEGGIAYPTAEALAAEYGLSYARVRKVAAKREWTRKRAELAAERERLRRQTVLAEEVRNLELFDRDCFQVARAGLVRAAQLLGGKAIKPSELVAITNAVRGLQVVANVATGRVAAGAGAADPADPTSTGPTTTVANWSDIVAAARKVVAATNKSAGERGTGQRVH